VLCHWLSRVIISGGKNESAGITVLCILFCTICRHRNCKLLAQNIVGKCLSKYPIIAPCILVSSSSATDLKDFVVHTV
jgi:hypothetical protein